jgi:hypothetical protein
MNYDPVQNAEVREYYMNQPQLVGTWISFGSDAARGVSVT